jgi:hypothetical protein
VDPVHDATRNEDPCVAGHTDNVDDEVEVVVDPNAVPDPEAVVVEPGHRKKSSSMSMN